MSVAFRRDCDEEHLEPKFELPLPPGPNLVTPRGLAMIEARNEALDADLEAEPATEVREQLLRERRYWRSRLATAQLAPAPAGDTVAIGTRVTIDQAGRSRVLDIVGHDESDPDAGRIAFGAPLARTLIGGRAGEEIETPPGPITIVSIQVLADT